MVLRSRVLRPVWMAQVQPGDPAEVNWNYGRPARHSPWGMTNVPTSGQKLPGGVIPSDDPG